ALDGSAVNPLSSSAGVLGGQVLALALSVGMSGVGTPGGLGSLIVTSGDFAGMSIQEILDAANVALGGGDAGFTISQINSIADTLNNALDDCVANSWAQQNLQLPQ